MTITQTKMLEALNIYHCHEGGDVSRLKQFVADGHPMAAKRIASKILFVSLQSIYEPSCAWTGEDEQYHGDAAQRRYTAEEEAILRKFVDEA
jgi:hypothetical protein